MSNPKKALGSVVLLLSATALFAAIWQPRGSWWQWLATAVVLLIVGAALSSSADEHRRGGSH